MPKAKQRTGNCPPTTTPSSCTTDMPPCTQTPDLEATQSHGGQQTTMRLGHKLSGNETYVNVPLRRDNAVSPAESYGRVGYVPIAEPCMGTSPCASGRLQSTCPTQSLWDRKVCGVCISHRLPCSASAWLFWVFGFSTISVPCRSCRSTWTVRAPRAHRVRCAPHAETRKTGRCIGVGEVAHYILQVCSFCCETCIVCPPQSREAWRVLASADGRCGTKCTGSASGKYW